MARVIFYRRDGTKELGEWMSVHLKPGDVVFERDSHFPSRTEGAAIFRKTYEDYLTEEDCCEIDALALKTSENWYKKDSGEDLSLYEGISLGEAIQYKLTKYFVSLFKDIALLLKLREKENPGAFVFIDDNSAFGELLKEFSSRYGIKREVVSSLEKMEKNRKSFLSFVPNFFAKQSNAGFREYIKSLLWHLLVVFKGLNRKDTHTQKTILIEAYGKFIPLIKRLVKEENKVLILGRLGLEKGLFHPNIFYHSWASLSAKGEAIPGLLQGSVLRNDLLPRTHWVPAFKSFDASTLIKKKLEEVINQDLSSIMGSIPKIKKFLISRKVNTIITLQDRDGINRILAACGNSLGIETVEIQHGALSNLPYLVSPISKKLYVWGGASKEFYLKRKIDEKRICMVGDPNLERLKKADSKRITALKKKLGLSPDKPAALFASQPFVEITSMDSPLKTLDLFEQVCEAARELSEIEFLIKFHPNENSEMKREILKRYRYNNLFVAERGLTSELLSLSRVLITFCSSIVLEASLLGIPVIMVNLTGKRDFLPVVELRGALGVYQKKDLIPSIRSVLYGEEMKKRLIEGQKRFIASQLALGGDSLKRMVEAI